MMRKHVVSIVKSDWIYNNALAAFLHLINFNKNLLSSVSQSLAKTLSLSLLNASIQIWMWTCMILLPSLFFHSCHKNLSQPRQPPDFFAISFCSVPVYDLQLSVSKTCSEANDDGSGNVSLKHILPGPFSLNSSHSLFHSLLCYNWELHLLCLHSVMWLLWPHWQHHSDLPWPHALVPMGFGESI